MLPRNKCPLCREEYDGEASGHAAHCKALHKKMSVERFGFMGQDHFGPCRNGAYVHYSDYEALSAEVERMERALCDLVGWLDHSGLEFAEPPCLRRARAALPSPPTEERTDREKNSSVDNHRLGGNSGSSMGSVGQGRLTTSPPANPSPKKPDPWGFDGLGEGGGS